MDSYNSSSTKPLYRATQVIWYLLYIIEAILAIRFVLKLLAANADAGFTAFIYSITNFLVAPFLSVFHVSQVLGSIFEWTTLLAMLIYWFVAFAIVKLLLMSRSVSTPEAADKLNEEDKK